MALLFKELDNMMAAIESDIDGDSECASDWILGEDGEEVELESGEAIDEVVAIEITAGASGFIHPIDDVADTSTPKDEEPSTPKGKDDHSSSGLKTNYSTCWDFCDQRVAALGLAMGLVGGTCVICNVKVGTNGAHPNYSSHEFAGYCSCGFSVLGRDGCRTHASKYAPQLVVIHAVSPENRDRLKKALSHTILAYRFLRTGEMS